MTRLFSLCLFITLAFFRISCDASYAKVLLIKGNVSYLGPGMKEPLWVTPGMTFKEDTSIVTREKSFIKIRILDDGSSVSLGPDSKMVVTKIKSDKGSIISLLNGQLRSKVEKSAGQTQKTGESKLYIKTRTAALGVRGTEFIAIANQENHVTSLITLEGEVAINKIDTSVPTSNVEKTLKEAVDSTEQVTLVKKGNTSTSYLHKQDLTPPAKVNPMQLIALKKNDELIVADKKEISEAKPVKMNEELKQELYAPDASGKIEDVPVNGGIVDLKSAIFIPEIKNEKLKIGNIDANTGEFIPLEGIKLDEKKGFVVASNDLKDSKEGKALALKAKELNEMVEYKEVPKNFAPGHDLVAQESKSHSFTMDNSSHQIMTHIGLSEFSFSKNTGNNNESTLAAIKFGIDYTYTKPWSETINLLTSIGMKAIKLDKSEYENEDNGKLEEDTIGPRVSLGLLYKIHQDLAFITKAFYEFEHLPVVASNGDFDSIGITTRDVRVLGFEISSKVKYSQKIDLLFTYKDRFQAQKNAIKLDSSKTLAASLSYQFESMPRTKFHLTLDRTDYSYNSVQAKNNNLYLAHSFTF